MAKGNFIIDNTISKKIRDEIDQKVTKRIQQMKSEVSERKPIIEKRQDFFEGRHHKWTNVVGQAVKKQEGHILAVFNYVLRFCQKIIWVLSNHPPKIKVVPKDESNDVETIRAETLEEAIYKVFRDNKFFPIIMEKLTINQVRDGDFVVDCRVIKEANGEKKIVIKPNENLLNIAVGWDDLAGTSFSFIAYSDLWSIDKIKRDFDYDADPISDESLSQGPTTGSHLNDQYGILSTSPEAESKIPSGKSKIPKARITDYWGYEVIKNKTRIVNLVYINKDLVQLVVSDYKKLPKYIGKSLLVAGKPWSMSFIDPLVDPQIELNDRTGEEGDLIRVGSHMKFLVINMPDFDPTSIKPGSGQVIFLEGENVDFRPLQMSISPFPSESYLDRVLDHLFNLGLPKIALAAGTAPYTGRVAAIQYQPVADIMQNYRNKWEDVLRELCMTIQQYFIDFFPETHSFMTESIMEADTEETVDGELIIRNLEFDWDNILPLSRSDKVIDAATLRDRQAISLHTFLEEAGFRDPNKEIKKLKKEAKDEELMALLPKFQELTPGVVEAQIEARKKLLEQEEMEAARTGKTEELAGQISKATQATPAPIRSSEQNEKRRGIPSGQGTPTGQTATPKGAVAQTTQNINARQGV